MMSSSSSKQSFIDSYFKKNRTVNVKKRSLSLVRSSTPSKIVKIEDTTATTCDDVINISSDEEDIWITPKCRRPCVDLSQLSTDSEDFTDCSQKTILYTPNQSPATPQKQHAVVTSTQHSVILKTEPLYEQDSENAIPTASSPTFTQRAGVSNFIQRPKSKSSEKTPQKAGVTLNSQGYTTPGTSYRSPKTREKFYSPTRKRSIVVKTPVNKVKRSLNTEMTKSIPSRILFEDDLFTVACEGMDDKTKFLLQTINNYLNTPTIKHLLSEKEQKLLTNCLQVVKPGMRLVCRLYWRKEGWFKKENAAQICSESKDAESIDDTSFYQMMNSLIENELIVQGGMTNMTFDNLVAILKRDELKQICKELKLQMNSKQDAVEALKSFSKRSSNISHFLKGYTSCNAERVLKIMSSKAGPCYKLSELTRNTLYKLYIVMFLGMDYTIIREKRLELILLYDKIQKEPYPIPKDMELDDASVVFRTRDEFERYLTAHNIYEDYLTRTDVSEKCGIVKQVYNLYQTISEEEFASYTTLPKWLYRYTPANIYVKILDTGIQDLKKEKNREDYSLASEILTTLIRQDSFRQHRKAAWYAEQALILHTYLSEYDEAAKVLLEGFKSDLSDEAKDHMRERAKKIANQKNAPLSEHLKRDLLEFCFKESLLEKNIESKHIHKQPMDRVSNRGKVKFETRTASGRTVADAEEFCIGHYINTGEFTNGEHWEGRIVNTLFFLLFWDIIYSKPAGASGVFLCRYQQFPLDLFTDCFYLNRRQAIDDWLNAIEHSSEEKLLKMMEDTWNNRPDDEVSGLSIGRSGGVRWASVRAVAACLGPARLAAICRRLARRYRYAHSGFPDLTLWNVHTKQIKFVEVKTDADRPSMKQRQWMAYLKSHGVDAEFCYVGAQTTRQRARMAKPSMSQVKNEK